VKSERKLAREVVWSVPEGVCIVLGLVLDGEGKGGGPLWDAPRLGGGGVVLLPILLVLRAW
jgi:hypothetical protein